MIPDPEIILDFDNSVSTEDRFAIRRFLKDFVELVNNHHHEQMPGLFSDAVTAEGFSEFVMQKSELLGMFYKKFFGRKHNFIRFPKLKLSSSKFLYNLKGSYEEYDQEILAGAGSIEISIIKNDDKFQFIKFKFYPRMRMPIPDMEQYD